MFGGNQVGKPCLKLHPTVAALLGILFLPGLNPTLVGAADKRFVQVVSPGQSIQAAIDRAASRGWVFILPGVYREAGDTTNGLNINAPINLVGLSTPRHRVVLENSGGQSNGIVAVPRDRNNCMSCHSSLAPPFAWNNSVHDNNKENTARPGSLAAELPAGTGIMLLGVDDSHVTRNRVENNDLTGIALVDVCVAFSGGPHDCTTDPRVTPEFLADQDASNNEVARNVLINNGLDAPPTPFAFAASDLTLLSFGVGNCYAHNRFTTSFSITGGLPACP